MAAGWHRAADSVAAFLLVGGWAAIAGACLLMVTATPVNAPADANADRPQHQLRWSAGLSGLTLALAAALLGALLSAPWLRESWVGPPVAFFAGALFIAGTATAVLVALLSMLPQIDRP
jgi:hypothetical protein